MATNFAINERKIAFPGFETDLVGLARGLGGEGRGQDCVRAQGQKNEGVSGLLHERQGQDLAVTVLCVPEM